MPLLTADDYEPIRKRLDLSLDREALPDETIDLFAPEAEREILTRDPSAATRTWTELERVTDALRYLTASKIALALPVVVSETLGDYAYQRLKIDPVARSNQLRAQAERELAAYLEDSGYPVGLAFARASGTRGW